jgi:hypothetical protein
VSSFDFLYCTIFFLPSCLCYHYFSFFILHFFLTFLHFSHFSSFLPLQFACFFFPRGCNYLSICPSFLLSV